ncbi:UDP-glycosyltransferase UGT5-like [Tribolium madens]|uniref:UDP-glycosyltransferase UGT5-like n=1 Tax=Tribolium madens TaxID=41895 RepID=UPI001CF72ADD|nr:UDP-glycosyltransferase UGT5-like [Tribolium madens]
MYLLKLFGLLSIFVYSCACYKFLALFQTSTKSHHILASKLFKEIANKGHEVTFITPFEEKTPTKNLNVIPVKSLQTFFCARRNSMFEFESANPMEKAKFLFEISYNFTEHLIQSKEVQTLLKSNEKFDGVIIYQYLNEALLGVAHHFKAPVILFSSMPLYAPESFLLSHPTPPSYVPNILVEYTGRMNFWQRLRNTFYDTSMIVYYLWNYLPKHRELVRKYIPGGPDLYDFVNNASLILINSHVSANEAIPLVPNAVEIGGFHIEEPKALPQDLQKFLDDSKNGVILFSMGSIVQSAQFPAEKRKALITTFSKLKENVLWKWEEDDFAGLPKNVKVMKWLPQSDVLAHPNVKAFISHGGLLSTMESVYHAVPIVGIPVMADQKMNIQLAVSYGYAVAVPYQELSEETLTEALNQVLTNPTSRNNIRKRSFVMKDRPIKPLDNALYWIEYVIRHEGAPHLRYPGMDLMWYQRNLLDIVGFVLAVIFSVVFTIIKICKVLLKGKSKAKTVSKKKKNN